MLCHLLATRFLQIGFDDKQLLIFLQKTAQLLDGIFSFVLVDTKDKKIVLARDSFGIKPMFYFIDKINHSLGVCSEMKGKVKIQFFDRFSTSKLVP